MSSDAVYYSCVNGACAHLIPRPGHCFSTSRRCCSAAFPLLRLSRHDTHVPIPEGHETRKQATVQHLAVVPRKLLVPADVLNDASELYTHRQQ